MPREGQESGDRNASVPVALITPDMAGSATGRNRREMTQMSAARRTGSSPLGTRSLLREHLSPSELSALTEVIEHAADLIKEAAATDLDAIDDFPSASAALQTIWSALVRALDQGERGADRMLSATSVTDLLVQAGASAQAIATAAQRHKDARVGQVREALGSIQKATSVAQLIEAAPRALCTIGFDRALLSSIEYSTWLTDAAHIDDDPEWAQSIVDAGRAAPQAIVPGLPEADVVRNHQPILVTRAHERRDVHKVVIEAASGRSYVAAPVMPRSKVVGFLHCDRIFHRGDVDEFDAEVLGIFAQGFSFAIERAITLRDLDDLRTHVRGFTQGVESFVRSARGGQGVQLHQTVGLETSLSAPPPTEVAAPQYAGGIGNKRLDVLLTRRELEVLSVMAEGDNNQRIAARLVIAEETVKSHVKNILRKLQVTSRAEAVARWHNTMNSR